MCILRRESEYCVACMSMYVYVRTENVYFIWTDFGEI
jgi:hypothetical protein